MLQSRFSEQSAENQRLKKDYDSQVAANQAQEAKNNELGSSTIKMQEEFSKLQQDQERLAKLSQAQEEANVKLQGKIDAQKEDNLEKEERNNKLRETSARLQQEFDKQRDENGRLADLSAEQEEANRKLQAEIDAQIAGIKEQEGRLKSLQDSNKAMTDDYNKRQEEHVKLEELLAKQLEENENFKKNMDKEQKSFTQRLLDFYQLEEKMVDQRIGEYQKRKEEIRQKIELYGEK